MAQIRKSLPSLSVRLPSRAGLQARALQVVGQFRNLDRNDPSVWPRWPRVLLCAGVGVLVLVLLWLLWLGDYGSQLDAARGRETQLRADVTRKQGQAANLPQLKKQRQEVELYVHQLEKQLPGKAEMDALLSDINQAGLGRNLEFELFKPGEVIRRDYYAEQPIAVRVVGGYHDMGAFAADIARLSRIVTLNDLSIARGKDGRLTLDATTKTYRYLDANEIEAQRQIQAKTRAKGGRP